MYAQTRPRFILSSEGVFGGMEFEPVLTPREKSPEEDRTRDTVDSDPKHYQLSYSGSPTLDSTTTATTVPVIPHLEQGLVSNLEQTSSLCFYHSDSTSTATTVSAISNHGQGHTSKVGNIRTLSLPLRLNVTTTTTPAIININTKGAEQ